MHVNVGDYPEDRYRTVPSSGWVSERLYQVRVSPSRRTPVYKALLYSGTVSPDGNLNATYKLWSPIHGEYGDHPDTLWYLEVSRDLDN